MKRKISRLVGVIIAMLMVCCPINLLAATEEALDNETQSVASDEDEIIVNDESGIPDVNLYNVVLEAGDTNQDGVLTKSEAAGIARLNAYSKKISSIEGIQYLTGLVETQDDLKHYTVLSLANNQISDLTPLEGMDIVSINLANNQISDITALKGKTYSVLDLRNNQISDISPLAEVKVTSTLELSGNLISDISPLSEMHPSKSVNLSNNYISDISALDTMIRYNANIYGGMSLNLEYNEITDIGVLAGESQYSELYLSHNKISDISPLGGISISDTLDLSNNQISDINSLSGIEEIHHLYLSNNCITDISILNGITFVKDHFLSRFSFYDDGRYYSTKYLYNLDLANNQVKEISALKGVTCERLNLSHNQINDISPVSEMIKLYGLNASDNQISDISKMKELTDMQYLSLSDNQVNDINPLSAMTGLIQLELANNFIENIDSLQKMEDLEYLNLSDNQISDINSLEGKVKMDKLDLSNNKIKDISILKTISFEEGLQHSGAMLLNLSNNLINDVSALSQLKLKYLDLSYNQISDISSGFCVLSGTGKGINLSHNQIKDLEGLFADGFGNGSCIDLTYNQITDITYLGRYNLFSFVWDKDLAYYDENGKLNKKIAIAEGNQILKTNALKVLSERILYYPVYKWNPVTEEYEPTDETWLDTEPFIEEPADKEKEEKQVADFVNRLYSLVLDRTPEEAGIDSWKNALLKKESSGVDAGYGFVFSPECVERNLSDSEFVEMLYNTFMNREADEGGKIAWVSQLNAGVEREKVLEGFIMSAEFGEICKEYGISVGKVSDVDAFAEALGHYCNQNADLTKFVARCYTEALGREYDPVGLEDWCRVIVNQEDTPKAVAQSFIFSEEFVGKGLSNEEYVKVLYSTFMGREADETGLAGWIAVLESGEEDRAKVLEGFADSEEFAGILGEFGLE